MVGSGDRRQRAPPTSGPSGLRETAPTGEGYRRSRVHRAWPESVVPVRRSRCWKTRENYKGERWCRGGQRRPQGPDQDSWSWASGQPGVLVRGGVGPVLAPQSPSRQTGRAAGCGVDQGHCRPGSALDTMELRPDTSHKENVAPRPATPTRPGKRLSGSRSEVAGPQAPPGSDPEPLSPQASPGPR